MPFYWFCHDAAQILNNKNKQDRHTVINLYMLFYNRMFWLLVSDIWARSWDNLSLEAGDQVRLKQVCSATEASKSIGISDIATVGIALSWQQTTEVLIRLRGCAGCVWMYRLICTAFCLCCSQDFSCHGSYSFRTLWHIKMDIKMKLWYTRFILPSKKKLMSCFQKRLIGRQTKIFGFFFI